MVEANIIVYLPDEAKIINQSSNFEIIDDKTIRFWGYNIEPGEFLTIMVAWPKGIIEKPFLYRNQIINWIFLLIALLLLIFFFIRAYRTWKF